MVIKMAIAMVVKMIMKMEINCNKNGYEYGDSAGYGDSCAHV